jgi:hypothetical protein
MEGLTGQNEAAVDTCELGALPLPFELKLTFPFHSCKRSLLDDHALGRMHRLLRPLLAFLLLPLADL